MKWMAGVGILAVILGGPGEAQELEAPVRLRAGGQLVDVEIGAAPFVHDLDGDGLRDLLVGQFRGGKLRVHRNVGTHAKPEYAAPTWFQAGGGDASVPAG